MLGELKSKGQPKMPVEFRELLHPDKKHSQGIVEMWTEIFPIEEAAKFPLQTVKPPSREEYEIRVIIWETRDIKMINGTNVNIYSKIIYDPSGWAGENVEKETDVHYNSKDGKGEFNWRMKFRIALPCEFPRLKFQVYDYSPFGTTIIGENILSLAKTMGRIQKEGEIEIPKTWLNLENPDDPTEDVGKIKFSMDIVTNVKAESQPVGDGWEEPNENPRLIPPTAGRGFGDKFAAVAFDPSGWKFPSFGWFRYLAFAGGLVSVLGIILAIVASRL